MHHQPSLAESSNSLLRVDDLAAYVPCCDSLERRVDTAAEFSDVASVLCDVEYPRVVLVSELGRGEFGEIVVEREQQSPVLGREIDVFPITISERPSLGCSGHLPPAPTQSIGDRLPTFPSA